MRTVSVVFLLLLAACGTPTKPGDFTPDEMKWVIKNVR